MQRTKGWHQRLRKYLEEVAGQPHEYGRFDCALFAAAADEVMTGRDLGGEFRGKYTSLKSGLKLIRKAGFEDHVDVFAQALEECPAWMAQVGDLAVVEAYPGLSVGVCLGAFVAVTGEQQIVTVPLTSAVRAFRI